MKADKFKNEHLMNQDLIQGCCLSHTFFNIYVDDLLRNWRVRGLEGIKLEQELYVNILQFAGDFILIQYSEKKL